LGLFLQLELGLEVQDLLVGVLGLLGELGDCQVGY
jgi:hypothetical protein